MPGKWLAKQLWPKGTQVALADGAQGLTLRDAKEVMEFFQHVITHGPARLAQLITDILDRDGAGDPELRREVLGQAG